MVCCDIIHVGHVPVDCQGSKVITMATCRLVESVIKCMPTFIANVHGPVIYSDILPGANSCCLQTCTKTINVVMYCMCISAFIVTIVLISTSYGSIKFYAINHYIVCGYCKLVFMSCCCTVLHYV